MEAVLKKWGNSVGLRLPSSILKEMRFAQNQRVEISAKKGAIIIRPAQGRRYSLAKLLVGITSKNRHDSIELGQPVGKEKL